MISTDETSLQPLRSHDDLLQLFHEACKPRERFRVGTEAEKIGVFESGAALPFDGPQSVKAVLEQLASQFGWTPQREYDGGEVIALTRAQSSVTLEPGGQLELSGAPLQTIHEICAEFRQHMCELRDMSKAMQIVWLGIGFHPFARREDLTWVPKLRYSIMREHLPTRGSMALDMMLRTATVQVNLDYESEQDAVRKLRTSLALQPIATAMFANSPFVEGRATGERSHRARVWLNMDPDRTGLLPFAWRSDMTFERYVQWALDVPMFLIKRGSDVVRATHLTFRRFMREGLDGHRATQADWETHLNTLFPEVRLKRTLEVRGADSQPTDLVCAVPALWKGLLYDDRAFEQAETLANSLTFEATEASREAIADHGLQTILSRRRVIEWAEELVDIAKAGLVRIGAKNNRGQDESIHLKTLESHVREGKSPADTMLARVRSGEDFVANVIEAARV